MLRLLSSRVRLAAAGGVSSSSISRFREVVPERGKDRVRLARRSRIRRRVERDPGRKGEKGGADSERFQLGGDDDDDVAVSVARRAGSSSRERKKKKAHGGTSAEGMARHRHLFEIDPAFPLWQVASDDFLAAEVGSPVLARDGGSLSVVDPFQDVQSGGDFRDAQLLLEGAEIELMDLAVLGGPPGSPLVVSSPCAEIFGGRKHALDLFEPEEIDGSFESFFESDDADRARAVSVLESGDDEPV